MPGKRKIILFSVLLVLCALGLCFLPIILILVQDTIGYFVNPLFSRCEVMDKTRLEEALSQGFDVNAGCCAEHMIGECSIARPNSIPLVMAVENGQIEAVRLLLEHGADENQSSDSGYPIAAAASQNRADMVQLFLDRGANAESQEIALRMAAHYGHIEIAKTILSRVPPSGMTSACEKLACSLVSELQQTESPELRAQRELFLHGIETCPDPNISCGPERLLSCLAKNDAHAPLIKALLERGADLGAKEHNGKSVRDYLRSFWDYDSRPRIKALVEGR